MVNGRSPQSSRRCGRAFGFWALVAALGAFGSPPARAASSYAFPLKVSSNDRYVVDQNGTPFRIQGEAAWSLLSNLTYSEAETYLANRAAKGFNAVLVNLIEHKFAVDAPKNRNGDPPFTTANDYRTPNPAYFAFADSIIDLAAAKGMIVLLDYRSWGTAAGTRGGGRC